MHPLPHSPIENNYLLYVDESGVPDRHPSQTTHFALAGLAIPATRWADYHDQIETLKARYSIVGKEIHVAWLLHPYPEQNRISGFDAMPWSKRGPAVLAERSRVLKLIDAQGKPTNRSLATSYKKSAAYVHLTLAERQALALDVCKLVAGWPEFTLFGDVYDKRQGTRRPDEEAFEQVVTRFQAFLQRRGGVGMIAYDLNESQVQGLTSGMAGFQRQGGLWRKMDRIVGHPFFVGSHTSSLIQAADVVGYALRRYAEKGETMLFNPLFPGFDRLGPRLVGLRHYRGGRRCACLICAEPR